MSYYRINPTSRQRCLTRIHAARKVTEPRHGYGTDGEGRHAVRVLCPASSRDDLVGHGFRDVSAVHDVMEKACRRGEVYARNIHRGWYTNPDGDSAKDGTGLCWGMVAYLGHGRWLAGYTIGGEDSGGYHLDTFYTSEMDAARAADSIAEHVAEKERDYQQRHREASELLDRIEERRTELGRALANRNDKRPCFAGIREEIADLIDSIREDRETLRTDYAGVL